MTFYTNNSIVRGIPLQHTEKYVMLKKVNDEGDTAEIFNIDCNNVATLICEGIS